MSDYDNFLRSRKEEELKRRESFDHRRAETSEYEKTIN